MELQKINLLNKANNSTFVTKILIIANLKDNLKPNYNAGKEITYNTEILKCNLCDYNDAYILVRGGITVAGHIIATVVAFKNRASYTKCITKIDESAVDDGGNLDLQSHRI